MFDSIIFERLGIPAVAIITEPFAATCRTLAGMHGFTDLDIVMTGHPFTSLTTAEVNQRGDALTLSVVEALTRGGSVAQPVATFDSVAVVVDRFAEALRVDGADLRVEHASTEMVRARLVIDDAECAECVMPQPALAAMLEQQLRVAGHVATIVELDDPRIA